MLMTLSDDERGLRIVGGRGSLTKAKAASKVHAADALHPRKVAASVGESRAAPSSRSSAKAIAPLDDSHRPLLISHPEQIAVMVVLYEDQVRTNYSGKPRLAGAAIAGMGIAILAGLILPHDSSAPAAHMKKCIILIKRCRATGRHLVSVSARKRPNGIVRFADKPK